MQRPTLALAVLALLAPAALAAQAVRGQLVDRVTELGIPSARVILLDEGGRRVATGLTSADGGFVLRAPAGGRYTVTAERVGYRSTTSAPLVLSAGETTPLRLASAGVRVALDEVAVQSGARCEVRPGSGAPAAAVWDEARKALDLARTALAERRYQYQVTRWKRQLDPRTRVVQAETGRVTGGLTERPFVTVDPATLADSGYVQPQGDTIAYNVPDAEVLLSDPFLDGHCFRVEAGRGADSPLVGLSFEPVRGRRRADVRGTIWMDRASAELRSVRYEYTDPPLRGSQGVPGGEVWFRRLPNGSWIVSRWMVRMPVGEDRTAQYSLVHEIGPTRIAQIREEGGEVTGITATDGSRVDTEPSSTLTGVVWDSTRAAPLVGARVLVTGTTREAVTDTAGRYILAGLREGTYVLDLRSPRLDSMGFTAPPAEVTLERGTAVRRDLAVPSLTAVLAAGCPAQAADAPAGILSGVVRDSRSAVPVPGVHVTLAWTPAGGAAPGHAEEVTDEHGVFRFCGAPVGTPLRLAASALGFAVAVPELTLQRGVPRQRDLALALARTRLAAADTGGRGDRVEAVRRGATSQRIITRAEIDRSNATNVRQLIEQLRPQWLRARGGNVTLRDTPNSTGSEAVSIPMPVYLDAQKLGGMSTLAELSTTDVELVEFLEPTQAALRFGADNPRGAIIVTTRAARHVR